MKRLLVTMFVLCLGVSCAKNPFSTRDSEPPKGRAGTFIPPTSPQIVLENLRFSYSELVIGNFIECLDSSFTFRFDYIQGIQGDTMWGYAQEINLTEKMFNDYTAQKDTRKFEIEFQAVPDQHDIILDTTATLVRSYAVTVADTAGTVVEEYEGIATFELRESAYNFWALSTWKDLHFDLQTPSWAELKSAYR